LDRDPLVVDFIRGVPGRERDLELALLADIERFMTVLGKGFSFYGRQLALGVRRCARWRRSSPPSPLAAIDDSTTDVNQDVAAGSSDPIDI